MIGFHFPVEHLRAAEVNKPRPSHLGGREKNYLEEQLRVQRLVMKSLSSV
jgi:hypothetical protein